MRVVGWATFCVEGKISLSMHRRGSNAEGYGFAAAMCRRWRRETLPRRRRTDPLPLKKLEEIRPRGRMKMKSTKLMDSESYSRYAVGIRVGGCPVKLLVNRAAP